jgi:hypothetical protein
MWAARVEHVQHEQPESWEDMVSFGEQLVPHMTMELAQQLARVGEKVSDSNEHGTEQKDEDSDGSW